MSQENVEIVRLVFDASNRRDAETVFALYDPDVEWDAGGTSLIDTDLGGQRRGVNALQAWFQQWHVAWERVSYDSVELIDAGDQVVSVITIRARGKTSGAEVGRPQYAVWTIRDGKIVRVVWHATREEALEAAGLSE